MPDADCPRLSGGGGAEVYGLTSQCRTTCCCKGTISVVWGGPGAAQGLPESPHLFSRLEPGACHVFSKHVEVSFFRAKLAQWRALQPEFEQHARANPAGPGARDSLFGKGTEGPRRFSV